jgi:hypothetical protein
MSVYRIEYSVQEAPDEQAEFVEIGFGSSGTWGTLEACTHMLGSAVDRGEWETEPVPRKASP